MENKYLKISKDTIWAIVKYCFAVIILYEIFVPIFKSTVEISRVYSFSIIGVPDFFTFFAWTTMIAMILVLLWCFLYELGGYLLQRFIGFFEPKSIEGIKVETYKRSFTKEDIIKLEKKFKRKIFKGYNGETKEFNYSFIDRVMNDYINKILR